VQLPIGSKEIFRLVQQAGHLADDRPHIHLCLRSEVLSCLREQERLQGVAHGDSVTGGHGAFGDGQHCLAERDEVRMLFARIRLHVTVMHTMHQAR